MVCPPIREIIHSLKLVDYLLVQADRPWYIYYVSAVMSIVVLGKKCQIVYLCNKLPAVDVLQFDLIKSSTVHTAPFFYPPPNAEGYRFVHVRPSVLPSVRLSVRPKLLLSNCWTEFVKLILNMYHYNDVMHVKFSQTGREFMSYSPWINLKSL